MRNTHPAIAGLNMLLPCPPKACFTKPIEKIPPIKGIHRGALKGMRRPKTKPVMTAVPSAIVISFPLYLCTTASVRTQDETLDKSTSKPWMWNRYPAATTGGKSEKTTLQMTLWVVLSFFIKGGGETTRFIPHSPDW